MFDAFRGPHRKPASKTTLSRGEAWPEAEGSDAGGLVVQSSCANTKAAKSTSRVSSRSRSRVDVPGLNEVVQGSTCATSWRPRVSACSSFCCFPDEPRNMRGFSIHSSRQRADGVSESDRPASRIEAKSPTAVILPGSETQAAANGAED